MIKVYWCSILLEPIFFIDGVHQVRICGEWLNIEIPKNDKDVILLFEVSDAE